MEESVSPLMESPEPRRRDTERDGEKGRGREGESPSKTALCGPMSPQEGHPVTFAYLLLEASLRSPHSGRGDSTQVTRVPGVCATGREDRSDLWGRPSREQNSKSKFPEVVGMVGKQKGEGESRMRGGEAGGAWSTSTPTAQGPCSEGTGSPRWRHSRRGA